MPKIFLKVHIFISSCLFILVYKHNHAILCNYKYCIVHYHYVIYVIVCYIILEPRISICFELMLLVFLQIVFSSIFWRFKSFKWLFLLDLYFHTVFFSFGLLIFRPVPAGVGLNNYWVSCISKYCPVSQKNSKNSTTVTNRARKV